MASSLLSTCVPGTAPYSRLCHGQPVLAWYCCPGTAAITEDLIYRFGQHIYSFWHSFWYCCPGTAAVHRGLHLQAGEHLAQRQRAEHGGGRHGLLFWSAQPYGDRGGRVSKGGLFLVVSPNRFAVSLLGGWNAQPHRDRGGRVSKGLMIHLQSLLPAAGATLWGTRADAVRVVPRCRAVNRTADPLMVDAALHDSNGLMPCQRCACCATLLQGGEPWGRPPGGGRHLGGGGGSEGQHHRRAGQSAGMKQRCASADGAVGRAHPLGIACQRKQPLLGNDSCVQGQGVA